MHKISFVLVNYCGAFDTIACIQSILENSADITKEIIVIDNASPSKGVYDIIKTFEVETPIVQTQKFENLDCIHLTIKNCTQLYIIKNIKNSGFGAANNIGIRFSKCNKADICVLLNNDTLVPQTFISNIITFLKEKEYKCALSVMSRYFSDSTKIDSEGFGYIDLYTGRSSHYRHYRYEYLVGSCIIMNSVQTIPLFDEKFFLYSEDADYSAILRNAGYILQYDPANYFLHKVNASTSINSNIGRIKLYSLIYFMKKHASFIQYVLFCMLRCMYYLMHLRITHLFLFIKNVWNIRK